MDISGWDGMYRSGQRGAEDVPTTLLVETAAALKPGNAIDLACGAGRNALFLAEHNWTVTAMDGSPAAIEILRQRAAERHLPIAAEAADLTAPDFALPADEFDLVLIAFYLQRSLFPIAKRALRPGGVMIAIVHTAEPGNPVSEKRAAAGELATFFTGWTILHYYEGPSRDPEHRRPVAEIVARRN